MRRFAFITVLWLLSAHFSTAQTNYINTRQTLGYLATVFTGIYPTDSCVYIKGV